MKINIYVSARQVGQKANQRSGCAIMLLAVHDDGRCQVRRMTFGLGNSTINVAALRAVHLAVLSIRDQHAPARVFVDSRYAAGMLERTDGVFRARPATNADLVLSIRELLTGGSVSVEYDKLESGIGAECGQSARDVAVYQASIDSGTEEFENVGDAGLSEKAE